MSNVKIDLKTIQHIAKLARLDINEVQAQEYSNQLTKIMGFFDKISTLSTVGVEPLVTPTDIEIFWREDKPEKNYSSDEMVANAPSRQGSLFKVPPVV
jgi:aspartyl-tRNA(Asn)/glutamyl-tRNA(Gln) amidotransferase subunit C